MKRPIAVFLIFACAFLLFAGTAFAGAAPDAASYFTHPGYNKAYTGEDGLSHTMTVKWVGETWNKLGTVIYSINYEDVCQRDANTYIDVMSATEIYENARPTYPDSPQHSVYQVKWYADGRKEVVSDYRPAAPEETPPPAQTERPEETPTTPSPVPTQPPATASKPVPTPSEAATDTVTTKPKDSATPNPAPESTATPTGPSASDSPVSSEETPAATPAPTPSHTEPQVNAAGERAAPSSSPAPEEEPEHAPQDAEPSRWVWPVIVLLGIGAAILLALYRRRKEEKDHEDHEA